MIEQIQDEPGRGGLRQRLFAWMHSQGESGDYDEAVEPYKRRLFTDLSGTLVEIGAGTGENFPYYPAGLRWIGVEPNVFMHPHLLERAKQYGIQGELRSGVGERLPLDDASADVVVGTLVMCSVGDQQAVLREILRVLKPGGRYLFLEHVAAARGTRLRWWQGLIKPVWKALADGCEPNRETGAMVQRAGFSRVEIQAFEAPLPIASPHIAGVAIK
jgi:ubiquinone/menaquinone biosynthesis C-methylase UbiE